MWPHIIIRIDPDLDRLIGSVFKLCFAFVLCLAASLPGSNLSVVVVVFIVPFVVQFVVVVVVVVVMFRQFDFIGCDYPAFVNIHGGSHVVVRSGFS